jgi:hypothetical protein
MLSKFSEAMVSHLSVSNNISIFEHPLHVLITNGSQQSGRHRKMRMMKTITPVWFKPKKTALSDDVPVAAAAVLTGTPHFTDTTAAGLVSAPQLWQNLLPPSVGTPHATHTVAWSLTGLPQFRQNMLRSSF